MRSQYTPVIQTGPCRNLRALKAGPAAMPARFIMLLRVLSARFARLRPPFLQLTVKPIQSCVVGQRRPLTMTAAYVSDADWSGKSAGSRSSADLIACSPCTA